jgi:hypothetical protein
VEVFLWPIWSVLTDGFGFRDGQTDKQTLNFALDAFGSNIQHLKLISNVKYAHL